MTPEYDLQYGQTLSLAQRNKVLQNTYSLLGLSMIPTAVGALLGKYVVNFSFMAASPILSTLAFMGIMMLFFWGISANRNNSMGVVLLLTFTLFMGVLLGPLLQFAAKLKNGAELVTIAAGSTALIFFTLSTIARTTKRDFSFLGKFLFVGVITLLVLSIANMFFHLPILQLAISAMAVMIFSLYILFDVQQIVNGGEDNYVIATLQIYLDIYNLFVNLLQLLMAIFGQRD